MKIYVITFDKVRLTSSWSFQMDLITEALSALSMTFITVDFKL